MSEIAGCNMVFGGGVFESHSTLTVSVDEVTGVSDAVWHEKV